MAGRNELLLHLREWLLSARLSGASKLPHHPTMARLVLSIKSASYSKPE